MTAKEDLKNQRISVLLHAAVGVVIGIVAPLIGLGYYVLAVAIAVAMVLGHATNKIVGKQKFVWWLGNGLFIYFLVVADMWIFVVNYF